MSEHTHTDLKIVSRPEGTERVLTEAALEFLCTLEARFGSWRRDLIEDRKIWQARYDAGEKPDFLPETRHFRNALWEVDPIPEALQDRRVEITGPVERKMMINALNSGAKVFMADCEDASSPRFDTIIAGQVNLLDYTENTLEYTHPQTGKVYTVGPDPALLIMRPRGLHLEEAHILYEGRPISACLFDFGIHFFHNAVALHEKGIGPFYYLPKLETYLEARLWNEIFEFSQHYVGLERGTIKATILIETLPAAFQMDEILFELRRQAVGLNCGRWDYIFSYIKCLKNQPEYILPDRAQVGMDSDFLKAYSLRLIDTCHRRRAHAMGGMAAQIPVKGDEAANDAAFEKVRADKLREVKAGHDGTWVAHPALVPVAMDVFDTHMLGPHQILRQDQAPRISRQAMLQPHKGSITEAGLRSNISIAVCYISAWLNGRGAVPLHNLMEDAATAEICRAQIWQWLKFSVEITCADGHKRRLDREWYTTLFAEEMDALRLDLGEDRFDKEHYAKAGDIFSFCVLEENFIDFLTLPAYQALLELE